VIDPGSGISSCSQIARTGAGLDLSMAGHSRRLVVWAAPLRVVGALADEPTSGLAQVSLEIAALQAIVSVSNSVSSA
jgi:hypothetical protein